MIHGEFHRIIVICRFVGIARARAGRVPHENISGIDTNLISRAARRRPHKQLFHQNYLPFAQFFISTRRYQR